VLRRLLADLDLAWGDPAALDGQRRVVRDAHATTAARAAALQALIDARAGDRRALCEEALAIPGLGGVAAAGLALDDDPAAADALIASWPRLAPSERAPVLAALVSRVAFARRLLQAIAEGRFARADLGREQARRIRSFGDAELDARLTAAWGPLPESHGADQAAAIAARAAKLRPLLPAADLARGHDLFLAICGPCHTLWGEGGTLGRDLTGAGRQDLDYLLENVLFPSATVPEPMRLSTLTLKDGRKLVGIVRGHSAQTITLAGPGAVQIVEAADVVKAERSDRSLMPEGLLDALDDTQARDLVGYLMTKTPPRRPRPAR